MNLQDIPCDSKILLTIGGKDRENKEEMCTFKHVDGMYSLILTKEGHAVHLGRMTEVVRVDDHYENSLEKSLMRSSVVKSLGGKKTLSPQKK